MKRILEVLLDSRNISDIVTILCMYDIETQQEQIEVIASLIKTIKEQRILINNLKKERITLVINNPLNLKIKKENKELKKQLEEITDYYCEASNIKWKRAKRIIELKTQQKEFIKYLEDEIKACKAVSDLLFTSNKEMKVYKEILQKYKEIIGVSDENKTTI